MVLFYRQVTIVLTGHNKLPTKGHIIIKDQDYSKAQALPTLPHYTQPNWGSKTKKVKTF